MFAVLTPDGQSGKFWIHPCVISAYLIGSNATLFHLNISSFGLVSFRFDTQLFDFDESGCVCCYDLCLPVDISSFTLPHISDLVRKLVTMGLLILCLSKLGFVLNTLKLGFAQRCKL
jgi:hypothetical protein